VKRAWVLGKRALALGLAVLLVLLVAAPVEAHWWGGFWLGLGTGALLTAPLWWPCPAYPTYALYPYYYPYAPYPYYPPYPSYAYPAPPVGAVPSPASPTTRTALTTSPLTEVPPAAPAPASSAETPSGTPLKCETVWVEGHYETHVGPSGQAATVRVPGGSRQLCQ
jgi:hypothetical protein